MTKRSRSRNGGLADLIRQLGASITLKVIQHAIQMGMTASDVADDLALAVHDG